MSIERTMHGDVSLHAAALPRDNAESSSPPVVLLNVKAGVKAQLTPERIRELFAEQGSAVEVVAIDRGDDLCAAAKAALEKGRRTLVAAGGDGTVNAVASCKTA